MIKNNSVGKCFLFQEGSEIFHSPTSTLNHFYHPYIAKKQPHPKLKITLLSILI